MTQPFTSSSVSSSSSSTTSKNPQSYDFQQPGQENMAWDIQRNTYIWEDPASGVIYSWDSAKEQWVLDETTLEDQFADTLADSTSPYNPEGETYDPVEGSEGLDEKKLENSTEEPPPPPSQGKPSSDTTSPEENQPPQDQAAKDEKKRKREREKPRKRNPIVLSMLQVSPKMLRKKNLLTSSKRQGLLPKILLH